MSYNTTESTGQMPNFCLFGQIAGGSDSYAMAECYILNPDSDKPYAEIGSITPFLDRSAAQKEARIAASITQVFFDDNVLFTKKTGKDKKGKLIEHIDLTQNIWEALGKCLEKLKSTSLDSKVYHLQNL